MTICEGQWGKCDNPGTIRPCMTAYANESQNVKPMLCDECFSGYVEYWQEMWAEWRSSQGL